MQQSLGPPEVEAHITRLLRLPYSFVVVPHEGGGFIGEVLEFRGCLAGGATAEDAIQQLREAARTWLRTALAANDPIPAPLPEAANGWLAVALPKSLHLRALQVAIREGVTLDSLMVSLVAERMGGTHVPDQAWAERLERAFGMVDKAPEHYRALLTPILLKAGSDPKLMPFVDLLTGDPFYQHLLAGKPPAPFL